MNLRPIRNFIKNKETLTFISATVVLTGFIIFLLSTNFSSQVELKKSTFERVKNNVEKHATEVSFFCSECKMDLANLAESRVISAFFENRALGMSMEYGLRANLFDISTIFNHFLENRKLSQDHIYNQIVFVDKSGNLFVNSQRTNVKQWHKRLWKKFLTPEKSGTFIVTQCRGQLMEIMVSIPYLFKEKYEGQIIACVSPEIVYKHFIKAISNCLSLVDCRKGNLHTWIENYSTLSSSSLPDFSDVKVDKPYQFEATCKDGTLTDMLAIRIPVEDTPFSVVAILPVSEAYGHTNPQSLLIAMGVFALVIVGGLLFVLRVNTQNLVLNVRLDEESKSKREIEEKNLQLGQEITQRKRVEEELKEYQEGLEQMVSERTRELEETQKELINKAIETGRAQLSAMVLHNIGNAMTPIMFYVEKMRSDTLAEMLHYMEKCYLDLNQHMHDLQHYVSYDSRGKEVFSYMGQLVDSLKDYEQQRTDILNKTDKAVSYISEALTLQNTYSASEQETKEQIDLNTVIEDAVRMQTGVLEKREIVVDKKLTPSLPKLLIDKNRLIQVIVNFIKNSYEAIDERKDADKEKIITFKSFKENGHVIFEITDNGIGIEPEIISSITEFGRSQKGSSGFGLHYCKMFVEANKGKLNISSAGIGKGATVSASFPFASDT